MNEKQWTPGPWRINDGRKDEECIYIEAPHDGVATVFEPSCWQKGDEERAATWQANAALIAAAPTLYDALEAAIVALRVALSRHETAIAMARADGAYVPEEFGEREADVFRITIRDATAALASARAETKP